MEQNGCRQKCLEKNLGSLNLKTLFTWYLTQDLCFIRIKGELESLFKCQCFYPLISTNVSINWKIPQGAFFRICVQKRPNDLELCYWFISARVYHKNDMFTYFWWKFFVWYRPDSQRNFKENLANLQEIPFSWQIFCKGVLILPAAETNINCNFPWIIGSSLLDMKNVGVFSCLYVPHFLLPFVCPLVFL